MSYKNIQERIPKVIYQLQFQSSRQQSLDLVQAVLLNLGYIETDFVQFESKGNGILELFNEEQGKLGRVKDLFGRLRLPDIKIRKHKLLPKDWLTLWKKKWRPAALTKKLDVVPVWYRKKYVPRRGCDFILMDTLLSFGTGLHETTQIMAQFIEDKAESFKSFLDIGTGTGILSLVAIKNGAQEIMAIDIGQLSVKASCDNMIANKLYFKVKRADIKKFRSKVTYDFVAANLVTDDLIKNSRKIISFVKNKGLLAVSGISLNNLDRLLKAFSILPLKCLKISKGKQWSGVLFQKMMS